MTLRISISSQHLTDEATGGVQILREMKRTGARPHRRHFEEANERRRQSIQLGAANSCAPYDDDELRNIVEKTLGYKLRFIDDLKVIPFVHEKIEFELPSDLSLMNGVLHFLHERVAQLGVIRPESSNLFIALDEAFVNAVKHGNRGDTTAEAHHRELREERAQIEDEGDGLQSERNPDPLDPPIVYVRARRAAIYKSWRVAYNERQPLTMVKGPKLARTRMIEFPRPLTPRTKVDAPHAALTFFEKHTRAAVILILFSAFCPPSRF